MDEDRTQAPADGDASLDRRLQEALEDRARLWEEVHRLRAELREMEYFREAAYTVLTSTSWRITRPLRASKTLAGWLRRRSETRPGG